MYEDRTRDKIHEENLLLISDEYDKTKGSFIYDTTRVTAITGEKIYNELNILSSKISIENLKGAELEQRVYERTGLKRKPATKASTADFIINGNGCIKEGDLFSTATGIKYISLESKTIVNTGTIKIQCTESGTIGNVPANQIKIMPITLSGITSVNNPTPLNNGYDAETDTEFLKRYYEQIQTPSTSGNKAQFRNWAKSVTGVGDAKVFPLWAGNNTIKIVIIDSNKQPASTELVAAVQNYIDPNKEGLGEGVVGYIGCKCTVTSAIGKVINISFSAVKDSAFTESQIIENVKASIKNYLKKIAFIENYVSIAKINNAILTADGVLDCSNIKVNDAFSNIPLNDEEIPVLGVVSIG